ncbi:Cro/CI family transcriptional regulator [Pseudomonas mosselii]|uniref:Cro/CI family transcriptional regulator n=1 Tax=Pseudomonas mosselii TaxID=78327 RepID=UPI003265EB7C
MSTTTLIDFVHPLGQAEAAKKLGSSQVAISKALKSERLIVVSSRPDGSFSSFEIKPFPSGGDRDKARLNLDEIIAQVGRLSESVEHPVHPSSSEQASP